MHEVMILKDLRKIAQKSEGLTGILLHDGEREIIRVENGDYIHAKHCQYRYGEESDLQIFKSLDTLSEDIRRKNEESIKDLEIDTVDLGNPHEGHEFESGRELHALTSMPMPYSMKLPLPFLIIHFAELGEEGSVYMPHNPKIQRLGLDTSAFFETIGQAKRHFGSEVRNYLDEGLIKGAEGKTKESALAKLLSGYVTLSERIDKTQYIDALRKKQTLHDQPLQSYRDSMTIAGFVRPIPFQISVHPQEVIAHFERAKVYAQAATKQDAMLAFGGALVFQYYDLKNLESRTHAQNEKFALLSQYRTRMLRGV